MARDLDPVVASLRAELGLGEPFADPGVALFGLRNAVMALGDCFVEVVSPVQDGTAAGRHLDRRGGDGGYMVMFDVDDLEAARTRARAVGVRAVWEIDLPDISGTHLHPADLAGAIVSVDHPDPPGSWRWAGPQWTGRAGAGPDGRLTGVTVAVADPNAAAGRWGEVLGVAPGLDDAGRPELRLDGGQVRFEPASAADGQGLVVVDLDLPKGVRRGRASVEVGGVRFRLGAA